MERKSTKAAKRMIRGESLGFSMAPRLLRLRATGMNRVRTASENNVTKARMAPNVGLRLRKVGMICDVLADGCERAIVNGSVLIDAIAL